MQKYLNKNNQKSEVSENNSSRSLLHRATQTPKKLKKTEQEHRINICVCKGRCPSCITVPIIETKHKKYQNEDKFENEAERISERVINNYDEFPEILNFNLVNKSLPIPLLNYYGSELKYDFSDVKIHTDSNAARLAKSLDALAFTKSKDIFFNSNQLSVNTLNGKKLLAHELVHVKQQDGYKLSSGTVLRKRILENIEYERRKQPTIFWQRTDDYEDIKWTQYEAKHAYVPLIDNNNYGTGTTAKPIVGGTRKLATRFFGDYFIAGHLLNNHLGGSGVTYNNITAFTSAANRKHSIDIEEKAKEKVKNKGKISYCMEIDEVGKFEKKKNKGKASTTKKKYAISVSDIPDKNHMPTESLYRVENIATHMKGWYKVLNDPKDTKPKLFEIDFTEKIRKKNEMNILKKGLSNVCKIGKKIEIQEGKPTEDILNLEKLKKEKNEEYIKIKKEYVKNTGKKITERNEKPTRHFKAWFSTYKMDG